MRPLLVTILCTLQLVGGSTYDSDVVFDYGDDYVAEEDDGSRSGSQSDDGSSSSDDERDSSSDDSDGDSVDGSSGSDGDYSVGSAELVDTRRHEADDDFLESEMEKKIGFRGFAANAPVARGARSNQRDGDASEEGWSNGRPVATGGLGLGGFSIYDQIVSKKLAKKSAKKPAKPFFAPTMIEGLGDLELPAEPKILYGESKDSLVFQATCNGATVVVKTQDNNDYEAIGAFENEIKVLYNLRRHGARHVVNLLAAPASLYHIAGRSVGSRIFVMEKLGGDLGGVVRETMKEVALMGLAALRAVHEAGYVHGDVKPGNFVFTQDRSDLKLIDFAFARPVGAPDESVEIRASDDLAHLSPSELKGLTATRRDDLFRFGEALIWVFHNTPYVNFWNPIKDEIADFKMSTRKEITYDIKMKRFDPVRDAEAPEQIAQYFEIVRKMGRDDEPDYEALKGVLNKLRV